MIKRPRLLIKLGFVAIASVVSREALALDSYRYLHVNLESIWFIFLVLLPIVLSPLILLVILYWRFSLRRKDEGQDAQAGHVGESSKIK
jgi:hypothetical protein